MKLYRNLLKALFWKAKDTKWIVLTASIIMMIISILFAVGDSVELSVFEASTNSSQYDLIICQEYYQYQYNEQYFSNCYQCLFHDKFLLFGLVYYSTKFSKNHPKTEILNLF